MSPDLADFLESMASEWRVDHYSVEPDGRLRIHYVSLDERQLMWSHAPHYRDLSTVPKVGDVGMLGFIGGEMYERMKDNCQTGE